MRKSVWISLLACLLAVTQVCAQYSPQPKRKKVELVEMRETLAADCNIRQRPILMRKVAEFSTAHTEYTGQKITAYGVVCKDKEGREVLFPGKTVICALGQRANRADVDALRCCAPFVREVGDCVRPANITKAIYEAYHAALDI